MRIKIKAGGRGGSLGRCYVGAIDVGGQFRFARNLVRKKSTSRTFNSFFEGYVNSRNLHTPSVNARFKNAAPQLPKHAPVMYGLSHHVPKLYAVYSIIVRCYKTNS